GPRGPDRAWLGRWGWGRTTRQAARRLMVTSMWLLRLMPCSFRSGNGRRCPDTWLVSGDDLTTGSRPQRSDHVRGDRVREPAHGAVGEQGVDGARVIAAGVVRDLIAAERLGGGAGDRGAGVPLVTRGRVGRREGGGGGAAPEGG